MATNSSASISLPRGTLRRMPKPDSSSALVAREYLRVSVDRSGRARSLDEQHNDNAAVADREGWSLGAAYRDEALSASRYARKARGGFADLLSDLDAGRFGAGVLGMWESSRGSRKVSGGGGLI